jgi:hypothetical protein
MSFFRHREIFRSDRMRSVKRCESLGQIAKRASNWKHFARRTRYKQSASMPDTLGYPQQTPQLPSTGLFHSREQPIRRPLAHRLDEFPAGYSSADCSPAGSASASPTVDHFALMSSRRSILFCRTVNSVLTVCLSSGDQRKQHSERDAKTGELYYEWTCRKCDTPLLTITRASPRERRD